MALFENPFATASVTNRPVRSEPGAGNQPLPDASAADPTQQNFDPNNQNRGTQPNQLNPQDSSQGGNGQDTTTGASGRDSLSDFSKLWEDAPVDPKNPPKQDTGYLPVIDSKALSQYFDQLDFTKSITPEELNAITAGGESAAKALPQILNKSLRQAGLTLFNASRKMVEQGLGIASDRFSGNVPNLVRDVMTKDGLTSSNPMMQNPAYAPVVDAVRQRFQSQYPKATPSQIETAVNQYFDKWMEDMGTAKQKKDANDPAKQTADAEAARRQGSPNADFEAWFEA